MSTRTKALAERLIAAALPALLGAACASKPPIGIGVDADAPSEQVALVSVVRRLKVSEIDGQAVKLKTRDLVLPPGHHTFTVHYSSGGPGHFSWAGAVVLSKLLLAGHQYEIAYQPERATSNVVYRIDDISTDGLPAEAVNNPIACPEIRYCFAVVPFANNEILQADARQLIEDDLSHRPQFAPYRAADMGRHAAFGHATDFKYWAKAGVRFVITGELQEGEDPPRLRLEVRDIPTRVSLAYEVPFPDAGGAAGAARNAGTLVYEHELRLPRGAVAPRDTGAAATREHEKGAE